MVISEKLQKNLLELKQNLDFIINNKSFTELQIENFLRDLEKNRYIYYLK